MDEIDNIEEERGEQGERGEILSARDCDALVVTCVTYCDMCDAHVQCCDGELRNEKGWKESWTEGKRKA